MKLGIKHLFWDALKKMSFLGENDFKQKSVRFFIYLSKHGTGTGSGSTACNIMLILVVCIFGSAVLEYYTAHEHKMYSRYTYHGLSPAK